MLSRLPFRPALPSTLSAHREWAMSYARILMSTDKRPLLLRRGGCQYRMLVSCAQGIARGSQRCLRARRRHRLHWLLRTNAIYVRHAAGHAHFVNQLTNGFNAIVDNQKCMATTWFATKTGPQRSSSTSSFQPVSVMVVKTLPRWSAPWELQLRRRTTRQLP